jgi:hypothetical protein
MTHYSLLVGSSGGGLPATSFVELTSGSSTFSVPTGYNAIHIQAAVGGGGGGVRGADYDKAGGESAGAAGGSGAYISDKVFSVSEGASLSYSIGGGGAKALVPGQYNGTAGTGDTTSITGLFSLTGGGGASASGGGVQGPLRTNTAGTAGTATIDGTAVTSGIFADSDNSVKNVNTNTSGPTSTFNDSGDGEAGDNNGNCNGDNCRINGSTGADSFAGNIAGGTGGSSVGAGTNAGNGTRGSGGGGGAAQVNAGSTLGGDGGAGQIIYRFLQVI